MKKSILLVSVVVTVAAALSYLIGPGSQAVASAKAEQIEQRSKYYLSEDTWDQFKKGSTYGFRKAMANNEYSGSVSDKYSHNGVPAYRFELRKDDPIVDGSKRSEIEILSEPAADEHTYKFSTLLPKGGAEDYALDPESSDVIAQWHNTPDQGEEWTNPPLALHVAGDGHYYLWRFWDEDPITTDQKMISEGKKVIYDLGSYLEDKGKWVDWTFHVKWGWLPSQHPIIQISKNGTEIFELKDQPNTTNDQKGVNMQFGIYKWEWGKSNADVSILTKRVIYFDNISIR